MKKKNNLKTDSCSYPADILESKIQGDILVSVPSSIHLMSTYILLEQEDWFEDEIKFIRHYLKPDMNILDIGANYGTYTLTMAKAISSSGHLWAFEPASSTASYLRHSIENNKFKNITLIQSALSDHNGTATLGLNQNSELNSLQDVSDNPDETETVAVTTLDSLIHDHQFDNIDFIKLDAEGEEGNIINGGNCVFIKQSPLVMFEIKHGSQLNLSLIEQFTKLDYSPYRLIKGLNILVPYNINEKVEPFQLNLFCCKQDRAKKLELQGILVKNIPDPELLPKLDADIWKILLSKFPYVSSLIPQWGSLLNNEQKPGWKRYRAALNLYLLAKYNTTSIHPAIQFACLQKAELEITAAINEYSNISRLQTYARILNDIGQRSKSVQILASLLNIFNSNQSLSLDEPFIPVMQEFEDINPGDNIGGWCLSAIISQYETLQAFSSYYVGDKSLQLLENLSKIGFTSSEMERRIQLIKARYNY